MSKSIYFCCLKFMYNLPCTRKKNVIAYKIQVIQPNKIIQNRFTKLRHKYNKSRKVKLGPGVGKHKNVNYKTLHIF